MITHGRKKRTKAPKFHPLSFGGWPDYQHWADNDFRPCPLPEPDLAPERPVEPVPPTAEEATMEIDLRPVVEAPPTTVVTSAARTPVVRGPESEAVWVDDDLVVRPYVRTRGRVSPEYDLRLETMLSLNQLRGQDWRGEALNPDLAMICSLCATAPQSVAEVSVYLNTPLGVTRVLIGDAIAAGLVLIHQGPRATGDRPSMELLKKVHEGLRRLR